MKYELGDERVGDPETVRSGNFIIGVDKSRNDCQEKKPSGGSKNANVVLSVRTRHVRTLKPTTIMKFAPRNNVFSINYSET